jgi:hypothetical protein
MLLVKTVASRISTLNCRVSVAVMAKTGLYFKGCTEVSPVLLSHWVNSVNSVVYVKQIGFFCWCVASNIVIF